MKKTFVATFSGLVFAGTALAAVGPTQAEPTATTDKASSTAKTVPKRVVVIMVDALSSEIVAKYKMRNVQRLMASGANFPNAEVGYDPSITVVTHNVVTTGARPKNMGWAGEGYRDVDGVLTSSSSEPDNPYWITSDLSKDQMFALQAHAGYPKLAEYLHAKRPGSTVATVSPKAYAAWGLGGADSDMIVTFSSANYDCDGDGVNNWRGPSGVNVPAYLSAPECGRWYVNADKALTYDTNLSPARLYPLDGNRYTVGFDPDHQGGDVWAADAALKIMENEADWSGVFLTLPGVDKAAHMWGGVTDKGGPVPMTHIRRATQVADAQVGRVMDYLRDKHQLKDTLVVLTADHGSVPGKHFHGVDDGTKDRGYYNWYYGDTANGDYLNPSPVLKPLIDTGNIGLSYTDSGLHIYLKNQSPAKVKQAARIMAKLPDVVAVFARNGRQFDRVSKVNTKGMGKAELKWFNGQANRLINGSAAPHGPDLVAALRDNTTYSVAGDHGGIQRRAQLIPIAFAGSGLRSTTSPSRIKSIDIMPTVLKAMHIKATHKLDGTVYRLP
jgi:predicted AlkP superfamily pyrophosphatase or phosphodiesterase